MTVNHIKGARSAGRMTMSINTVAANSLLLSFALGLAACGGSSTEEVAPGATATGAATVTSMQVAQQDRAIVDTARIDSGPVLSGTLVAERIAQLRPQVGGTVLAMYAHEGDRVAAGQLLAVIDTLVLADQVRSARLGLGSAELAAQTAERNLARSVELHQAGAIADRDLEAARNQEAQARAMLEDARARVAGATKQLENAMVRAPFSGVVSEVPVSVGDVVQPGGNPIAVVIDGSTLELEAAVPAAHLAGLKVGAPVEFTVAAHPGRIIAGTVARVNPAVDPVTGQLRLYVRVPNADRSLASGLFAEGRVALESKRGLAIPETAVDMRVNQPVVKRVRGGVVEEVRVTLGLRDELHDRIEVTGGLAQGDTVLTGAAIGTPVGTNVRFGAADN
jgi:RND family efflux transporter MFP subunit